jgi:hypothetical protein
MSKIWLDSWILLQEVQLQIWRQITKNCLWIFSVIKLNLDIKINILSFGSTLGLIWRLSRYGSGCPGIEYDKHYYLHVCLNIGLLESGFQINLDNFDPAPGGPAPRSGGKSLKIFFMFFNLSDFFCNKVRLKY